MSFAEVALRLGTCLVAWMVIYAYLLWVAVLRVSGCDADGEALWRLLLGVAPAAALAAGLVGLTRPISEVHELLRWGRLPLLLLLPLSLAGIWPTFERVTVSGLAICGPGPAPIWQAWWAPLQLLALTAVIVIAWRRSAASR
ncbi:MAG: hypothetical protein RIB46_02345 [Pseudomonadales bacterium]